MKWLCTLAAVVCTVSLLSGCVGYMPSEQSSGDTSPSFGISLPTKKTTSGQTASTVDNTRADSTTTTTTGKQTTASATVSKTTTTAVDGTMTKLTSNDAVSSGTWKQDRFLMSCALNPWTLEDIRALKEAGYNLVKCVNFDQSQMEECVQSCEQVGDVFALYEKWHWYESYTQNEMREVVNKYAEYDSLLGYNIWDEITPGVNNADYRTAKTMIYMLNKYDPNSLKYMCLLPSYGLFKWDDDRDFSWDKGNYEDYVDHYINYFKPQVLSFDYYPYLMGHEADTSDWWRDMGLYRVKSIEYGIPFWYYYQACLVNGTGPMPTEAEIKYQMYTGLAYGAKELSAWNGQWDGEYGAFYVNGGKTPQYETVKARNWELRAVGNFLFNKTSQYIYHTGIAKKYREDFYLDDLSESPLIKSAPDRLILSVFTDGKTDTQYLLVVNRNTEKKLEGTIRLKTEKNVSVLNKNTGKAVARNKAKSIEISLPAGCGDIFILQ